MMRSRVVMILLCSSLFAGCQTAQPKTDSKLETPQQMIAAFGTVTEGLTNQNISKEDLKNLAVSVQKDPQTQSAVRVVNQALNAHQTSVKYCPVDGSRFDVSVDECPIHQVKLKLVE